MTVESQPQHFQEIEIKLKLDEQAYNELTALFPVERQPALQENIFFDTADYTLLKHHWGLRIRKEETDYYLTAKGPEEKNTDAYIRPEYETLLTEEEVVAYEKGFKLSDSPALAAQELRKRFGDLFISPIFSFSNRRQFLKFHRWVIELDRTVIKDQVFFELEVETDLKSLANCQQKLKDFFKLCGWAYEPSAESKMERAIRIFLNI